MVERGDAVHEALRVGVGGALDDVGDAADLDDAAGIHDGDAVGGLGDDAHVVGDEHDGGAAFAGKRLEQLDDLSLDRNVERGGGLVGDDEAGLGAEGERDDDALAHAAGEFVRVGVESLGGGGDADALEPEDRPLARLGGADRQMRAHGFHQLAADGVERVQRGQRILEDGADLLAADRAELVWTHIVDAFAVEPDLATTDAAGRLEQADDGGPGERLAGAALADDAEDLAGFDLERDAVERKQLAAAGVELDGEVVDLEQGHQRSLIIEAWD